MPQFKIHTHESGRGIYMVEADSAEEAAEKFNQGDVTNPDLLEMLDAEVNFVEEVEKEEPEVQGVVVERTTPVQTKPYGGRYYGIHGTPNNP